jgi:hypothetical protein
MLVVQSRWVTGASRRPARELADLSGSWLGLSAFLPAAIARL